MILLPAIDLLDGACVRLRQGRFEEAKRYSEDPVAIAHGFEEAGARVLHVVDLDGARAGARRQTALIERIVRATGLALQVGGGVRTIDDAQHLINAGAARVVLGTIAVRDIDTTLGIADVLGAERITLALDVRARPDGTWEPMVSGWRQGSGAELGMLLDLYRAAGLRRLLCTDVERDGMLVGPSLELYRWLRSADPSLELLASGGIASYDDLDALRGIGAYGAILGRALYEGRIDLSHAVAREGGAC